MRKAEYLVVSCLAALLCLGPTGCNLSEDADRQITVNTFAGYLKDMYKYWVENGRSKDFHTAEYIGSTNFFLFTNQVTVAGHVYQCRFGARDWSLPPGVLTITDEGPILRIRDKDGRVIVSPEKHGLKD